MCLQIVIKCNKKRRNATKNNRKCGFGVGTYLKFNDWRKLLYRNDI